MFSSLNGRIVIGVIIALAVVGFALWRPLEDDNGSRVSGELKGVDRHRVTRVGVFRKGVWLFDIDGKHVTSEHPPQFGSGVGEVPLTGDWNGDGRTKIGLYRTADGTFMLDYDGDGQQSAGDRVYNLGVGVEPGDVPVVGDWNGDGKTKIGLFRKGFLWILDFNGNGVFEKALDRSYAFGGIKGDQPVVGDWNGSGSTKIGVVRNGFLWVLDLNGNGTIDKMDVPGGDTAFAFGGLPGDIPVVGDWNGDGRSDAGTFRSGFLWILDSNGNHKYDGTEPGQDVSFPFGGIAGDVPITGKW